MPEYLAPGVYVEEVSFRSKSIEGVPTSTTGYAGMTRFGPVRYDDGPLTTEPRLITSFTEFERVYGGLEPLRQTGDANPNAQEGERACYVGHAVRAFFMNGGKRVYISRVFAPRTDPNDDTVESWGVASLQVAVQGFATATWRARWPGRYGNVMVRATPMRSKASARTDGGVTRVQGARLGSVIEVVPAADEVPAYDAVPEVNRLRVVHYNEAGEQQLIGPGGGHVAIVAGDRVSILELKVSVADVFGNRPDGYESLATHPKQVRYIGHILQRDDPEDETAVVWLDWRTPSDDREKFAAARLLFELLTATATGSTLLKGGHDGAEVSPADLEGKEADPDKVEVKATGLAALGEIDDIAIVALPDAGAYQDKLVARAAAEVLVTHATNLRYRIAVVDGPQNASMNEIREFRGFFDSKYAALYHPWIEILDPLRRPEQGAPPPRIVVPPSGFVTGIYARSDIERGVHKAPANEVVRGLTKLEININKARQDVLNPEGINALRFFEGRGNRVWGARTVSSDPEWKYVNVRRLFIYIEHSIDKATQWAVFEPNNRQLWDNIRSSVEDFLLPLWMQGALLGDKPEQAYFVRCDRTTMTQNDIDNGRMICLVGIAPTKPAEFVIFRVGQWTGDAKR